MASAAAVALFRSRMQSWYRAQVGTTESPRGSNRQKYSTQIGAGQGLPWCGTFVTAGVYAVTGVNLVRYFNSLYTPTIVNVAKRHKAWKGQSPLAGDWSLMNFLGGDFVDHVGAVYAPPWTNVEGNTSGGGSQSNGGAVLIKNRTGAGVTVGWVDIVKLLEAYGFDFDKWAGTKGGVATPVKSGGKYLTVNGKLNTGTIRILQTYLRVKADGELGPVTVKAIQNWIIRAGGKLPKYGADGGFGAESARGLEAILKLPTTTIPGWYPGLIRGLQDFLNGRIAAGKV